jgi:hypothetical protein
MKSSSQPQRLAVSASLFCPLKYYSGILVPDHFQGNKPLARFGAEWQPFLTDRMSRFYPNPLYLATRWSCAVFESFPKSIFRKEQGNIISTPRSYQLLTMPISSFGAPHTGGVLGKTTSASVAMEAQAPSLAVDHLHLTEESLHFIAIRSEITVHHTPLG